MIITEYLDFAKRGASPLLYLRVLCENLGGFAVK